MRMNFINRLHQSIVSQPYNNAFYINDRYYTYGEFAREIQYIRNKIRETIDAKEILVGVVTHDTIETYAALIALWMEGKGYVALSNEMTQARNEQIIHRSDIKYVLDIAKDSQYTNKCNIVNIFSAEDKDETLDPPLGVSPEALVYIIFTSGSTGTPKGVPISFKNLDTFVKGIDADPEFELTSADRCLQMFQMTFDFSVVSFLLPLLASACIYPIPANTIKYFHVVKLLKEKELTVLSFVPSMINYLKPYFQEINFPAVRYCSFGGGALFEEITKEWSACIPNAKIYNYYGPTETTIYSSGYLFNSKESKTYNGVLSIGKPIGDLTYLIIDENDVAVEAGGKGELCIEGSQLSEGYWKAPDLNENAFFEKEKQGKMTTYYKTGDRCFADEEGYYYYVDRIDFLIKLRGFRVELTEVEYQAKKALNNTHMLIAFAINNKLGNNELCLAIQGKAFDTLPMLDTMKKYLPEYMLPKHIKFVDDFQYNTNGKIDRKALVKQFEFLLI